MTTKPQRNKRFKAALRAMAGTDREKSTAIAAATGASLMTVEIWKTKNGKYRTIPEKHLLTVEAIV